MKDVISFHIVSDLEGRLQPFREKKTNSIHQGTKVDFHFISMRHLYIIKPQLLLHFQLSVFLLAPAQFLLQ
jgi:hypothetical protein